MRLSFLSDVALTVDSISTVEIERRNRNVHDTVCAVCNSYRDDPSFVPGCVMPVW